MAGRKKRRSTHRPPSRSRNESLVFISHDSGDAELAKDFAELLAGATGGTLKSFCSSDTTGRGGIQFGDEWYRTLIERLGQATDVVVLLTPQSVGRPWVLFEAGLAKGAAKANVFGVAVNLPLSQAIKGPFAQFQNCAGDEEPLTDLVMQLISRNLGGQPRKNAVRREVHEFCEAIKRRVRAGAARVPPAPDQDVNARLFEEVKLLARDLRGNRNLQVVGPRFFKEFPLVSGSRFHPLGWLMFIGALRDELPWLYEIGLDLYRALSAGDRAGIQTTRETVLRSVQQGLRNPWVRSVIAEEDRERAMRYFYVADLVDIYLGQLGPKRGKAKGKTG